MTRNEGRAAIAGVIFGLVLIAVTACGSYDENGDIITPAPTADVHHSEDSIEVVTKTLPDGRQITCLLSHNWLDAAAGIGIYCLEPTEVTP